MKRFLRIFLGLIALILLILIVSPFLFKDKIQTLVKEAIDENIEATVNFSDVGLSFIRNFPNARVSVSELEIIGQELFSQDTLMQSEEIALVVDLLSVIGGGEIKLNRVIVDQPKIVAKVLETGEANWDIFPADSTVEAESDTATASESFQLALKSYEINNADIIYDDATYPVRVEVKNLDHSGNGDFTAVNYDLRTQSEIEALTVDYDGIQYMSNAVVDADVNMNIDTQNDMLVKLRDNIITINELPIHGEGSVILKDIDIDMDLELAAQDASFKSLLSLVPAVYTEGFESLQTEGTLDFHGNITGTYNESRYPGFDISLNVPQAMMKYPDLPSPVKDIRLAMQVKNSTGDLNDTEIDIKDMHADLAGNPLDASAQIKGLEKIEIDGQIDTDLDLAAITKMFPVEGNELRGQLALHAKAKGLYDEVAGLFPTVKGNMNLSDGYVSNTEYNVELTDLNMAATLDDVDGSMKSAVFDMPQFSFKLDGEPVEGMMHVQNFDDPEYRVQAKGKLDLEKLMKIYPIDSMELKGQVVINDFETAGKMSDIEAEKYGNLPTSGDVEVSNLYYSSPDLDYPLTMSTINTHFTPQRLEIEEAAGKIGHSDFEVQGYLNNYIAYALMEDEPLKGAMILRSNELNLNDWMVEEDTSASEEPTDESTESDSLGVIPVPANLDLLFQADVDKLTYGKYKISDMQGALEVINQQVLMDDVGFKMLGGDFNISGSYNTKDIKNPLFAVDLGIASVQAQEIFNTFTTAQAFAPIAQYVQGAVNMGIKLGGPLTQDLSPVLSAISGDGNFEFLSGALNNPPLFQKVAEVTKLLNLSAVAVELNNLKGKFEISNGFINLRPIKIKQDDILMIISGRQSIAGQMDFDLELDMPTSKLENQARSAIGSLIGANIADKERTTLDLKILGDVKSPKISASGTAEGTVGDLAENIIKDKLKEQLGDSTGTVLDEVNVDELSKDSLKSQADKAKKVVEDSLKAKVEEQVKEKIGEEAKSKLDSLTKKLKLPFGKKKKN